ncbi:MAG: hypothetical protein A3G22_06455 [Alphaproteobacteria bacterium RIFCSPLOWO2_12_FULL_40_11]|nr:MAG: hypothetical protein A3G22_06455 [Alphaproteobacteria bacterium RIFCSPLOWO2_12_FULL_40_11]
MKFLQIIMGLSQIHVSHHFQTRRALVNQGFRFFRKLICDMAIIASVIFSSANSYAAVNTNESNISLNPNEVLLEVHGIVCSFCSFGVQKKLSKLSFVDLSKYKKGSLIEIEKQRVTIAIKPNEQADIKLVYDSIRSGGYNPKQAWISDANGKITHYDKDK